MNTGSAIHVLCSQCGLCCNGVLFADVRLQPGEDVDGFRVLGLPVRRRGKICVFSQPCAALKPNGQCGVYEDRPGMCRQFECGVLKRLTSGRLEEAEALSLIRRTRKLVAGVQSLLEACGNSDAGKPLTKRYQKIMRQPIDLSAGDEAGDRRGELMLAVHALMETVHEHFLQEWSDHHKRPA